MKISCSRPVFYILRIPIPGQLDISSHIFHWNMNFHGSLTIPVSSMKHFLPVLMRSMISAAKRPDYYELSVKGHLFHFFYLLFSSQGTPVTFNRDKSLDKVKQIVSYIESHYTERLPFKVPLIIWLFRISFYEILQAASAHNIHQLSERLPAYHCRQASAHGR